MAIIEYMPSLASQLGENSAIIDFEQLKCLHQIRVPGVAFFDDKLGQMSVDWLYDCVFTVREVCILFLPLVAESCSVTKFAR